MSNINYDVTFPVNYDWNYKHYLARYIVGIKPYKDVLVSETYSRGEVDSSYEAAVSFDDGKEIIASGQQTWYYDPRVGATYPLMYITVPVQDPGPFKRVYIRNTHPEGVFQFYQWNTEFKVQYSTKALFEIQFNSVGFASNQNAKFRCSTIPKNCIAQYEWVSAVVYYKKSFEATYKSIEATVSGTWSDVNVTTGIGFEDGYTYDVYIRATADDGSIAQTPVAQFSTVDAPAVATCISPVGAFTSGEVRFSWAHSTEYGTPQYAYDLRYSGNNGGSWIDLVTHNVTTSSSYTTIIEVAGGYIWQIRTYNTNDVAGEWVQASFVNNVPATPPMNVAVTTEGRPTVSWSSPSQSAYQVQAVIGDDVVYDSGAIYSAQTSHLINEYLEDEKRYTIKVRVYNALGEVSEWVSTGFQQPTIPDVQFEARQDEKGGVDIVITKNSEFEKYYLLRNGVPIAVVDGTTYYDRFAVGDVSYSVIGVTSVDNSDIKSFGIKTVYPKAMIITLSGQTYAINKRFNETYSVKTASNVRYNKAKYLGDSKPSHFADEMIDKSFSITCFDEYEELEKLLGQVVFYADNFGNGGYCFVTDYSKENDYLQMPNGTYANEVTLTLEVTSYDDSIEYEL